ncbi:energy-coupling factor transporter ATPase [Alterileibacterium massiliense]|uniref:energy-coupling factor transporter ATPase n=1 Tax=Alterileibacterium massiliense TaxID=1870997 RepID=UPI0008D9DB47|nr:energy-coupling factor transporter ATPase [Alterileibacterium massiliense]
MYIQVKNLNYTYSKDFPNQTKALDDVSFGIEKNSILGVAGHTGSGKSTLLQMLNGLLRPDDGEIFIGEDCITEKDFPLVNIRKKVGLVFQYPEYQLFEETVRKDVIYGPKNLGIEDEKELEEIARDAISKVGLDYEMIKDRSPFELSGGQKRRVAIAGVIAMKPEVLILDEPTAGLDPESRHELINMIQNIQKNENIILIFVSHNMNDIAKLADKMIVLDRGKIAMEGTPREVFEKKDELNSIGLGVPKVTEIMHRISEEIEGVKTDVLTLDEALEEIARVLND